MDKSYDNYKDYEALGEYTPDEEWFPEVTKCCEAGKESGYCENCGEQQ